MIRRKGSHLIIFLAYEKDIEKHTRLPAPKLIMISSLLSSHLNLPGESKRGARMDLPLFVLDLSKNECVCKARTDLLKIDVIYKTYPPYSRAVHMRYPMPGAMQKVKSTPVAPRYPFARLVYTQNSPRN